MKSLALQRSLTEAGSIDQNMLRYVLDQSLDCIKILGAGGEIKYINSHGRCALEIDDFSAIEDRPWPELWPEGSREIIARAVERAQAGRGSEIEASRPDPRGEERWWRISVSPLAERDGELVGMLTISRDVTAAMLLRETEQTLALEMRHRLRNAYTIASAIVMQSARGNAEALPFAEMVCGRLADVAISQTQLLEAGDKSWSLAELVRTLITAHGEGATSDPLCRRCGRVGRRPRRDARFAGGRRADQQQPQIWCVARRAQRLAERRDGRRQHRHPVEREDGGLRAAALTPRDTGSGYAMMERMARAQGADLRTFAGRRAAAGAASGEAGRSVSASLGRRRASAAAWRRGGARRPCPRATG